MSAKSLEFFRLSFILLRIAVLENSAGRFMILTNPFDRVLFAALVFILLAASSSPGQTKKPTSLAALAPAAVTLAETEGLTAHGSSISIRLNR